MPVPEKPNHKLTHELLRTKSEAVDPELGRCIIVLMIGAISHSGLQYKNMLGSRDNSLEHNVQQQFMVVPQNSNTIFGRSYVQMEWV